MSRFDSRSNLTKSIRSSISLGLGNITFIYGHRTRAIVETRQTEDGKGEMGSRARSWGGLLCTWPTCGTPAVTREGIEAFARISSRFWPRTESEVPWIFPIRDEILRRDLSFSLPLSALEEATCRRDPRVGVRRRRISRVETSSSPLCRDDGDPETWITVAGGPGRAE